MNETNGESRDERYADIDTSHLEDVEDGCGCTEIWEHTSERAVERSETAEGASGSERSERHASREADREEASNRASGDTASPAVDQRKATDDEPGESEPPSAEQ